MEFSDRGKWVTHLVTVWIENDRDLIEQARSAARRSTGVFGQWARGTIRCARPNSAAWHVRQELAPNDYDRVHWEEIATGLLDSD